MLDALAASREHAVIASVESVAAYLVVGTSDDIAGFLEVFEFTTAEVQITYIDVYE